MTLFIRKVGNSDFIEKIHTKREGMHMFSDCKRPLLIWNEIKIKNG